MKKLYLSVISIFWIHIAIIHPCFSETGKISEKPAAEDIRIPEAQDSAKEAMSVNDILNQMVNRYNVSAFSAHFDQKSTIVAMDITDTASGTVLIKKPDMMRWEYETPEKQIIITNDKTLWVYRPEDGQVMVGESPAYFENGKGASFLTDLSLIKDQFDVSLVEKSAVPFHVLKLIPKKKKFDVKEIYLWISKVTFDINEIITYNNYGDETRIILSDFRFDETPSDDLFNFEVPQGADLLHLDD